MTRRGREWQSVFGEAVKGTWVGGLLQWSYFLKYDAFPKSQN